MEERVMDAWAAGLFEGEGTFYVHPRTGYVQVLITMTDLDVLEKFATVAGAGKCWPIVVNRSKYANTKPIYRYMVAGRQAGELIRRMLPYLGERRSAKARECLAALDRRYHPVTCEGCGCEFTMTRAGQRFCTGKCRRSAGARRRYHADRDRHRTYARNWARQRRGVVTGANS